MATTAQDLVNLAGSQGYQSASERGLAEMLDWVLANRVVGPQNYLKDDAGNYILDESGNKIIIT